MHILITTRPESLAMAVSEWQKYDPAIRPVRDLAAGVKLLTLPGGWARFVGDAPMLLFTRHVFPVQYEGGAAEVMVNIDLPGEKGSAFSVQARNVSPEYIMQWEGALTLKGWVKNAKHPAWVLSVYAQDEICYAGVSQTSENRSRWNGGAVRYSKEGTLSRAELKLTEALETFSIPVPPGARALDLGAAPGGWTKVLLEAGAEVTAVDPGALDARITAHPQLRYVCATAQRFFAANKDARFDILVNDMKMDMYESARIMADAAFMLADGGCAVMTFKLKAGQGLAKINKAMDILRGQYRVAGARQLFHNRDEITVFVYK